MAHTFAYLPLVPLTKYGGPVGTVTGLLLMFALVLGYQRFTRRFEQRADRVEREAIADANAYMRSLVKLHQANLMPAVMPGAQTHPHLYDRLLAGGIQPDFPRPPAPSRAKPLLAALLAAFFTMMFLVLTLLATGVALRLWQRWK